MVQWKAHKFQKNNYTVFTKSVHHAHMNIQKSVMIDYWNTKRASEMNLHKVRVESVEWKRFGIEKSLIALVKWSRTERVSGQSFSTWASVWTTPHGHSLSWHGVLDQRPRLIARLWAISRSLVNAVLWDWVALEVDRVHTEVWIHWGAVGVQLGSLRCKDSQPHRLYISLSRINTTEQFCDVASCGNPWLSCQWPDAPEGVLCHVMTYSKDFSEEPCLNAADVPTSGWVTNLQQAGVVCRGFAHSEHSFDSIHVEVLSIAGVLAEPYFATIEHWRKILSLKYHLFDPEGEVSIFADEGLELEELLLLVIALLRHSWRCPTVSGEGLTRLNHTILEGYWLEVFGCPINNHEFGFLCIQNHSWLLAEAL